MMLDFSVISRQRKALMGVAILFIMLYHLAVILKIPMLQLIFSNGDIGVEMFAVLSGIGIYYSLSKDSAIEFYKRRIVRVVPSFLMVVIPYALSLVLCHGASWRHFLSLVSGVAPLFGDYTFWFVTFIMLCYLISPVLYFIICRKRTLGLLAVVAFVFTHLLMSLFPSQLSPLKWIFRFSDFILGVEVARCFISNDSHRRNAPLHVSWYLILLLIIALFLALVRDASYTVLYFSYFITIIPLLYSFAIVLDHFQRIQKVFCILGGFTLEIYLLHEHVCVPAAQFLPLSSWISCAVSMILAIALAICVSKLRICFIKFFV